MEAFKERTIEDKIKESIETHEKAMDDLVSVNSLFTIAVFVGLAFATPGQRSLENREECDADVNLAKRLIVFEVISFALFLLSSLVAKSLKLHLNVHKNKYFTNSRFRLFKEVMLPICTLGSLLGCLFLMLSMVDVLQIRLGKLICGTSYTLIATVSLTVIVSFALLVYMYGTMYTLFHSMRKFENRLRKRAQNKN